MPWEFTDDVELYAEKAWALLATRPAENTISLTLIEKLRVGVRWSDAPMVFGWYESGSMSEAVRGAVCMTPPFELLLAAVPDDAMDELVGALRAHDIDVPGVNADVAIADKFTAAWTGSKPCTASTKLRLRLYALDTLRPPTTPPPGRARAAVAADFDMAADLFARFHAETDAPGVVSELDIRDRIENGLLWLWEDGEGTIASLSGGNSAAAGVARVGPVYTPPQHRRLGYGTAATCACTLDALNRGAERVVLFTDLANPTSNAIYQQIGYRPLRDQKVVHYTR
jgi:predicted GNAT family acetyltransferase